MQIREQLEQLIDAAVAAACEDGTLTLEQAPEAALERPRDESNGDWASTVAMRSAKLAKKNPREIAQIIVDHLPENDMIASVDIAGPGFINIRLANAVLQGVVAAARAEKDDFGKGEIPEGERKINLEYISANPTGPLHVGHGRWAALGDATARVMRHAGYDVFEEFYINDAGTQMDNFGESVAVRYQQLLGRDVEMPEACYAGSYVKDIAQAIIDEDGDKWLDADPKERMENFRERAYAYELAEQHRVTERFGTTFECWFSERSLYVPDETGKSAVDRSLGGFEESKQHYSEQEKVVVTGTPGRGASTVCSKAEAKRQLGLDPDRPLVVSVWGSLGASYMNEVMTAFITRAAVTDAPFALIHSAGRNGYEKMHAALLEKCPADLAAHGMDVRPYIYDMPLVMDAADLVLCRAGASTLAELSCIGKPAILIPSPNVTNNHQGGSARVLDHAGGAKVLLEGAFTADDLYNLVSDLLADPAQLAQMAQNMKSAGVSDAAERIADLVLKLADRHAK